MDIIEVVSWYSLRKQLRKVGPKRVLLFADYEKLIAEALVVKRIAPLERFLLRKEQFWCSNLQITRLKTKEAHLDHNATF